MGVGGKKIFPAHITWRVIFQPGLHEIWLSLPVSPAVPRGHVRWTRRLDMLNYSTDPEPRVKGEGSGMDLPPLSG